MLVYTGIFNRYDKLAEPCVANDDVEYVCFTDSTELTSDIWDIRLFSGDQLSPAGKNRFIKMFPHRLFEGYSEDVSVYIDGNIQILCDPTKYIHSVSESPIAAPKHPNRSSIDEEVNRLIELGIVNPNPAKRQLERYHTSGFTNQVPLTDNCILVRKHSNPRLQNAMADWWNEYQSGISRDQVGLGYALWKHGITIRLLDDSPNYWLTSDSSRSFRLHPHRPDGFYQVPWEILMSIRTSCSTSLLHTVLYTMATFLLYLKIKGVSQTYLSIREDLLF